MRINVGIPVQNLSDEHLRAEELEISMMPGFYNRVWKGKTNIPQRFTLGPGHISFFMNKKSWTLNRYKDLHQECIRRGINVNDKTYKWNSWEGEDVEYHEEGFEKNLIIERIQNNLNKSNGYFHYNHKKITKGQVIDFLKA